MSSARKEGPLEGGRSKTRSTGALLWPRLLWPLPDTLTHNPTLGVFIQVRSNVTHHCQDVAAGGDVDLLPTKKCGEKIQTNEELRSVRETRQLVQRWWQD